MASLDDRVLELLGAAAGAEREADPALVRIAHELDRRGFYHLGLVPASDGVDVRAAALRLAFARACASGALTAVVDARGAWTDVVTPEAGDGPLAAATLGANVLLVTRRTPAGPSPAAALRAFLDGGRHGAGRLVVDLTGFDGSGEHLEAASLLDAVSVVARAGRTTLAELDRRMAEVGAARNAGVLLLE
jgi:hypothetical protein